MTQPQLVETTLTVEPTESPTATPIVLLDAEILLWARSADQALAAQLNNEVGSYANANGYSFAVTPTLSAVQLSPNVRLVVSLASPTEAQSLASVLPRVQFLVTNSTELTPTENLSLAVASETNGIS